LDADYFCVSRFVCVRGLVRAQKVFQLDGFSWRPHQPFHYGRESAVSEGPIHDYCRNTKDPNGHRGHCIDLPNDPNVENTQWLRPSRSSEEDHDETNRKHNNAACEIHADHPILRQHNNIRKV
jgi:hypothetical protein